jgi:sugar phosphate isomerase/epimerase
MKLAICNETFRHHDFPGPGPCAEAARHGYNGLEIAPFTLGNPATLTIANAEKLGSIVRDHGLETVGFHWLLAKTEGYHLTDPDPAVHARTFDYARHLAELCSAMGGRSWSGVARSNAPSNPHGRLPMQKRASSISSSASPRTSRRRASPSPSSSSARPKRTSSTPPPRPSTCWKKINSPNVRLHLDVKAMSADTRPIPEIVRDSLPWAAHFHANDPNLRSPGMGEIDFPPIAAELIRGGYEGWVSVEVFATTTNSPDTLAAESMRNLRAAFR